MFLTVYKKEMQYLKNKGFKEKYQEHLSNLKNNLSKNNHMYVETFNFFNNL